MEATLSSGRVIKCGKKVTRDIYTGPFSYEFAKEGYEIVGLTFQKHDPDYDGGHTDVGGFETARLYNWSYSELQDITTSMKKRRKLLSPYLAEASHWKGETLFKQSLLQIQTWGHGDAPFPFLKEYRENLVSAMK